MSAPVNRSFDHKLIGEVNRGLLYATVDWPYVTISDSHRLLLFLEELLGSLSRDVFERRTSTGSEPFSLVISLYATVFVLPSVLILKGTICPKICSEARLKCAKSLFPVDVRRSKTSLLKLPDVHFLRTMTLQSF